MMNKQPKTTQFPAAIITISLRNTLGKHFIFPEICLRVGLLNFRNMSSRLMSSCIFFRAVEY